MQTRKDYQMVKNWWKILAALLVIYGTVFSFFKPLEPGLIETNKTELNIGENSFSLTGYNTHFLDHKGSNEAVIVFSDEQSICCQVKEITDNNHVSLSVTVPAKLSKTVADLLISNPRDGTVFLQNAFLLKGVKVEEGLAINSCGFQIMAGEKVAYEFPFQPLIFDTIRNLNFHVPMWFTMFVLMGISLVSSIMYLSSEKKIWDLRAANSAKIAIVFCILGLITGSIWARFTWGDWWLNDAKLNGAAVSFLLLSAYFILRKSAEDKPNAARIASVYNIISFFMIMALIMVLPRLTGADSIHPGEDGNPAFSQYDLDSNLRMVFYPACAGWIMTGIWIYNLRLRITKLQEKHS